MNIEQARFNMIEQQIRPWDVLDPQVLDLLFVVKREDFVPPAYRNLAFADMEIPLGGGQQMLAPKIEAKMLQELTLKKIENGYLVQTWGDETNRTIYCEDLSAVNETLDALFNPPAPVAD